MADFDASFLAKRAAMERAEQALLLLGAVWSFANATYDLGAAYDPTAEENTVAAIDALYTATEWTTITYMLGDLTSYTLVWSGPRGGSPIFTPPS